MYSVETIKKMAYKKMPTEFLTPKEHQLYMNFQYAYCLFKYGIMTEEQAKCEMKRAERNYNIDDDIELYRKVLKHKGKISYKGIKYDRIQAVRITDSGISVELIKGNHVLVARMEDIEFEEKAV